MPTSSLTYVRSSTFLLSPRCVNRCGFCVFPQTRYRAVPSLKRWRQWLRQARAWDGTNVVITGGEPVTKDREILQTVRYYGHEDVIAYLQTLLATALEEHHGSFLATLDLGELRRADLQRLRPLIADYWVGIVPFDPTLFGTALLWNSPTMVPPRRLDLLETLGQLRIPTTVNMLVGLGECESSRLQTLAALAEIQARRGHLQGVRISPFVPQPGTPLEGRPRAEPDTVVRTVRQAAEMLGPTAVQVPAFAVAGYIGRCVDAGAHDLGAITADPAEEMSGPARAWGKIERELIEKGHRLIERLPLTESAVSRGLYPESLRGAIARQLEHLEQRHVRPVARPAEAQEAESAGAAG